LLHSDFVNIFGKIFIEMSDNIKLLVILISSAVLIFSLENLVKRKTLSTKSARKMLHILAGILISFSPIIFNNFYYPFIAALAVSAFSIATAIFNLLPKINTGIRQTLATLYFSISFALLLIMYWENYRFLISITYILFVIGDAIASITDNNSKRSALLTINSESKTLNYALGIFISTFILFLLSWFFLKDQFDLLTLPFDEFIIVNIIISTVAMLVKVLSRNRSDNLFLPIIISFVLYVLLTQPEFINSFSIGYILSAIVVFISIRLKLLNIEGALVTFLLALFIFGLGEWKWTIPILVFFAFSSLLSKVSDKLGKSPQMRERTKGSERDMLQVFANGGISLGAVILNFLFPNEVWYFIYLVSLSVSMTDTWSTEIGTWLGKKTYLITTLKQTEKGISGGVSVAGTIGGIIGSIVVISSGLIFVNLTVSLFILLVIFGTIGSLIDSLMGATIQSKYRCSDCESIVEIKMHCSKSSKLISGMGLINNDAVNFISAFIVSIIFYSVI
jgi:uncharacterized protein (TIGR00297 family)